MADGSNEASVALRGHSNFHHIQREKKVVSSATIPDKTPPLNQQQPQPAMASLLNPAAVLAPPAALPHNPPTTAPATVPITIVNPSNHHHHRQHATRHMVAKGRRYTVAPSSSSGSSGGSSVGSGDEQPQTTAPVAERREATDFIFGKIIGEGSFSTVYLAKDIHNRREYAIKVCMKNHIIRERKVEQIRREREILSLLSSKPRTTAPFFVKIYSSFQDNQRLYFVLSYAKHGELFAHINKVGSFDATCTQFYAAEILHALEHMHSLGIVHRDLKPENILLDENMHIQITDFGSAKLLTNSQQDTAEEEAVRRNSFVGTAQYISPELLSDSGECSRASDLWAFGAIIYQMVSGLPPFRSNSEYLIFRKIKNLDYEFPEGFCPKARDLVQRLLVLNPQDRLGTKDSGEKYTSIREHVFFEGVEFESLYKQTPPPIYPYLPQEELRSQYRVPDHLEPGLDDRQITRLLGLELQEGSSSSSTNREDTLQSHQKRPGSANAITYALNATDADLQQRLAEQKERDPRWHALCNNNLILKQGIVNKRKGLFARRRMLLLTLGPHLYYVDPDTMTLKGEIPWSPELRVEPKNFKIFFVHTPDRTYYLHDPDGYALEWCNAIETVRQHYYANN